jgi:thiamine kinase-like enzyme
MSNIQEEIQELTRIYEEDQASGKKAVELEDIPISYEAITPEWLTATLCQSHPGARVVDCKLGPRDSGTSARRRIFMEYNRVGQEAGLPASIFAKASQELIHRISYKLNASLHAETNFYNIIRPQVEMECPRSFHARSDDRTFNSIVLLEDIGDHVDFCDEHMVISKENAISMVTTLADLHAPFATPDAQARLKPYFDTWQQRWKGLVETNQMKDYTNKGFLEAREVIPERLYARFDQVWPATMASVAQHDKLPHTYCHGDTHLANWYRTHQGAMGITDWQGSYLGHWSRDLIYAIGCALTIENRRAWQEELIKVYVERMAQQGVTGVSYDETYLWCRQQAPAALAYWTVTYCPSPGMPEDMQPKDRALAFVGRLAATVDDLESLDSFD